MNSPTKTTKFMESVPYFSEGREHISQPTSQAQSWQWPWVSAAPLQALCNLTLWAHKTELQYCPVWLNIPMGHV